MKPCEDAVDRSPGRLRNYLVEGREAHEAQYTHNEWNLPETLEDSELSILRAVLRDAE